MITTIEYALMAGHAYLTTRDEINWLPVPQGWTPFFPVPDPTTPTFPTTAGFEAVSFIKGTEIVISFAGTDPLDILGDQAANISLATGLGSEQLLQAVDYYLQVMALNPDATITFTGHSLGGGLAALMGVFFGKEAVTFDQAPFANTAEPGFLDTPSYAFDLKLYLTGQTYTDPAMAAVRDAAVADLDTFLQHQQINGGIPNSDLVTNISVQGEILTTAPYTVFDRIGTQWSTDEILNSSSGVSGTDLHSQALLTAFLQSKQTALTGKALNDVTYELTDLMAMIFDSRLFYNDPNNKDAPLRNLLEHMVRHEAGVQGSFAADAMVSRFTSDLWKIAQDGGLTMSEGTNYYGDLNNVSNALIAFAMQFYYEDTANATDPSKQLFTDLSTAGTGSNGIQFAMADVSSTFAAAVTANEKFNLKDAKGFELYFKNYIGYSGSFTPAEQQLINSVLPYMRDWYVQAGASGMLATDTLNRGAFMLGGAQGDALVGGTGNDLLVGNGGDDLLQGKAGNDFLIGGAGNDAYVYSIGDGFDTILDKDGNGSIAYDGAILGLSNVYGDDRVHRDADGHLYVDAGSNRLVIDGNILIEGYDPNQGNKLGLTLTGPVADVNPITTRDIYGDLASDGTPDDLGNPDGAAAPDRADTLYDSAGKDHIMSYGGDDLIYADKGGDDIIEAGTGRDKVLDFGGNDVIMGGADGDILWSGTGNDRIYAVTQMSVADAIAQGNGQTGTGLQGDWLAGGLGDDTLIGATDNDVLSGGNGKDLLIGGAGDDDILGDVDWVASIFEWTVTDQPDGTRFFYGVEDEQLPAAGATDVIYAGEGNDHAWGGFGNDVIFGEGGGDILYGEEGNDILLGGSDSDKLWGGTENDYLDGGDGADQIIGGTGDDILIGGKGIDTLWGEAGRDIYIFNRGDGGDTVYDTQADNNIFRFGAGINSSDITLNLGSLKLNLGNGDEIHIAGFNQNDVFNSSSISGFEFAANDQWMRKVA